MVKGLGAGDEDDDAVGPPSVELTEVGVTDTLGLINPGVFDFFASENSDFCSLAADRPNTISSSLRRFFSLPITGSSAGYKKEYKIDIVMNLEYNTASFGGGIRSRVSRSFLWCATLCRIYKHLLHAITALFPHSYFTVI